MRIASMSLTRVGLITLMGVVPGADTTLAKEGPGNPVPSKVETIPCPMSLPEEDIDGKTMVCGQIEVPENWSNPSGRTISLTYAIAKAHSEAPFPDPIIFFEGGPGISALEEIEWLDGNTSHLRLTRDIIFFDQRGIRYSSALECPPAIRFQPYEPELPEDVDQDEVAATIASVTLDSDPMALVEAADLIGPTGEAVNCRPYFEKQGVDLSQYGSYSNALDSIALMNALDYPSYNLYGISYGSNHTMEVMRYYDENDVADLPAIRSIVIDGVIGSWISWVNNNAMGRPVVTLTAFEACEADPACSAAYPDIRQRAIDILAKVDAKPLVIDDSTTITAGDLSAVLKSNAQDPESLVYLPRLIDELEQRNADLYQRLQEKTLPVDSKSLAEFRTPLDPISLEANNVATQMRVLAEEVESLSALSRRLSEAYQSGLDLPRFFAEELADIAEQLPAAPQGQVGMFLQSVPVSSPDRDRLLQAVSPFPEGERNLLISLIGLMGDEDVAQVYATLSDPLYSERFTGIFSIIAQVIHCNDRVFDLAGSFETLRAFDAPQLIDGEVIDYSFGARCAGYGLAGSPVAAIVNSSGFPVLVSNGATDALTPRIWGESVHERIQNSRMITFPNLGHGATRKTPCSRDITSAFFMYPEAELNLSCVETLRPVFVLPGDDLPE